jgi:hypothetical protein
MRAVTHRLGPHVVKVSPLKYLSQPIAIAQFVMAKVLGIEMRDDKPFNGTRATARI